MMRISISQEFTLDFDAFKDEGIRIAVLARSGGGKSNLVALVVEQLLERGVQVCIIEPIAEYYTLKSAFNDVLWVSNEGDVPIFAGAYGIYTDLLEKGASLIITVGDLEDEFQEKGFVASFLQSLYQKWKRVRRPIFVVIEEAEGFAPQMWAREDRPCLAAISKLAKRGRKLGINLVFATQRPADVHKAVLSQANVIFLGGFKASRDLEAVKDYAKLLHLPIDVSEVSRFEPGEFYAIALGEIRRIKALLRRTPHGGQTPQLQTISPSFSNVVEEARKAIDEEMRRRAEEEDFVRKLMARVRELEEENAELRRRLEVAEVVKEVPLEIKAEVEPIKIPVPAMAPQGHGHDLASIPEAVFNCPHKGALRVYQYLSGARDFVNLGEVASATGMGIGTVKKVVRYFWRKGLVRCKMRRVGGKNYVVGVRLRR